MPEVASRPIATRPAKARGKQAVRSAPDGVIALVVLDLTNPFFAEVAQGAASTASSHGFTLVITSSDGDPANETRDVNRLTEQGIAGLIVAPSSLDIDHLQRTSEGGTPVVLLDHPSTDGSHCSVSVDNVEGGRLAGRHLIAQGHSRIAFVSGPTTVLQAQQRREVLALAAEQKHLDPATVIVDVTVPAFTTSAGYLAAATLLREPDVTAAFCANDLLALGVERSFAEQGRKIPQDLAVVGYDDVDFTAIVPTPLTTVRQPKSLLGQTAAELLIAEISGDTHTHDQQVFGPELVLRQSTTG
jgi:LacI family transcriptional regulator